MQGKIIIIGAGLTGAMVAAEIRQRLPNAVVTVYDKARKEGGRMTSSVSALNTRCIADLGAQYVTTSAPLMTLHKNTYDRLLTSQLLVPLSATVEGMRGGTKSINFVAPEGMASLVKSFLEGCDVEYSKHVTSIDIKDNLFVVRDKNNVAAEAEAVVCTIPVPQVLQLGGVPALVAGVTPELEKVTYSSRFVLVLFFDSVKKLELGWNCKYVTDHPVFRYISVENQKRNRRDQPTAIVFHTSVEFGEKNLERSLQDMEVELMRHVVDMFPDMVNPTSTKCHKWRYSQVVTPYKDAPGCVVVSKSPLFILAGDAFSESNFDGCIKSAKSASEVLVNFLTTTG